MALALGVAMISTILPDAESSTFACLEVANRRVGHWRRRKWVMLSPIGVRGTKLVKTTSTTSCRTINTAMSMSGSGKNFLGRRV